MALIVVPKAAIAALCFFLLSGAHSIVLAAEISAVTASGRAALSSQSVEKVRRIALEDALYLAAISAGTEISGAAISSNGVLVRDVISLNTNAQLVDFSILAEQKTETHYEVSVEAFFAKKSRTKCQNPRYPSIFLLKPNSHVASNVHIRYRELAGNVSNQLHDFLLQTYPGITIDKPILSLEDYRKSISKNRLFSYSALQTNQPVTASADFIVEPVVRVVRSGKFLNTDVKMTVFLGSNLSKHETYESRLTSKLPEKSPFKTINVLTPKDIGLDTELLIETVERLNHDLTKIACKPLEARLQTDAGQLTFPFGQDVGLKTGSLAYVTGGNESWSLLEVRQVLPTSSFMVPINNLQNKSKFVNQTIRIIEGTIR